MINMGKIRYWIMQIFDRKRFLKYWNKKELKQYSSIIKAKTTIPEFTSNLFILLLILFLPCILILFSGAFEKEAVNLIDTSFYTGSTTILSSLSVIIIMALVFTLEINKSSIPGASSFLYVIALNYYYLPVIAWIMGVVMAGIVFPYITKHNMLINDGFASQRLFLAMIVVSIMMLFIISRRTLFPLGKISIHEQLTKLLIRKHRYTLNNMVKWRIMVSVFQQKLGEIGFEWNPIWKEPWTHQKAYSIRTNGELVDVDLRCLKKLKKQIDVHQKGNNCQAMIVVCPGEIAKKDKENVLMLPDRPVDTNEVIQKLLNNCFIYTKARPIIEPIWEEFIQMLIANLRNRDIETFKNSLNAFKQVIVDYLEVIDKAHLDHKELDPLEIQMCHYIAPSLKLLVKDTALIDVLDFQVAQKEFLNATQKIAIEIWRHNNIDLFKETLQSISYLYNLTTQKNGKSNFNGSLIVNSIRVIYESTMAHNLNYTHIVSNQTVILEKVNNDMPYYYAYLKANLSIARRALERGNLKEYYYATDQFIITMEKVSFNTVREEFIKTYRRLERAKQSNRGGNIQNLERHFELIKAYLIINKMARLAKFTLCAWVNLLLEKEVIKKVSDVIEITDNLMEQFGGLNDIIEIYLFRGTSFERSEHIDELLDYTGWDYRDIKSFELYKLLDPEEWLVDYWIQTAFKLTAINSNIEVENIIVTDDYDERGYNNLIRRIKGIVVADNTSWMSEDANLSCVKKLLLDSLNCVMQRHKMSNCIKLNE